MAARRPLFNVQRMRNDMTLAGLHPADVARRCQPPVARSTVTRFLSGDVQTARMAKRLAEALGYPLARYVRTVAR